MLEGLSGKALIADKAYDRNALRALLLARGMTAVIPCNPTRRQPIAYDFAAYKRRNHVERTFNKIKHFRRLATRYDRKALYFQAFLSLACALLWLPR